MENILIESQTYKRTNFQFLEFNSSAQVLRPSSVKTPFNRTHSNDRIEQEDFSLGIWLVRAVKNHKRNFRFSSRFSSWSHREFLDFIFEEEKQRFHEQNRLEMVCEASMRSSTLVITLLSDMQDVMRTSKMLNLKDDSRSSSRRTHRIWEKKIQKVSTWVSPLFYYFPFQLFCYMLVVCCQAKRVFIVWIELEKNKKTTTSSAPSSGSSSSSFILHVGWLQALNVAKRSTRAKRKANVWVLRNEKKIQFFFSSL